MPTKVNMSYIHMRRDDAFVEKQREILQKLKLQKRKLEDEELVVLNKILKNKLKSYERIVSLKIKGGDTIGVIDWMGYCNDLREEIRSNEARISTSH